MFQYGGDALYLRSWMMVSASDWLLMMVSSLTEQLTLFSVVNIPLTSRYAHSAITRDCCWMRGGLKQINYCYKLLKWIVSVILIFSLIELIELSVLMLFIRHYWSTKLNRTSHSSPGASVWPAGGAFVKQKACKLTWRAWITHSGDLWFLQGQPVCLPHVWVGL